MQADFPSRGRILAVDFGTVRIGLAICDPQWILASPLDVVSVGKDKAKQETAFRKIIDEQRVDACVVGLPIHCDGGESEKSRECRKFALWLQDISNRPVRLFDERFTTSAAKRRMSDRKLSKQGKKKRLDAVAALVLLESFLEACRYHDKIMGQQPGDPADGDASLHDPI